LPVVVLADQEDAMLAERCVASGAAAFLDKLTARESSVVEALLAVSAGERLVPLSAMNLSSVMRAAPEPESRRSLSIREREVLRHLAAGADNLKIAALLGISERTVKAHVSSLYRKLGQENRTQMALYAQQLGLKPSFRP
jgi:DNA-binding NarL/FixJ family response regulator